MRTFGHLRSIFKYLHFSTSRLIRLRIVLKSTRKLPQIKQFRSSEEEYLGQAKRLHTTAQVPFANARIFDREFAYRGTRISTGGHFENVAAEENCHRSGSNRRSDIRHLLSSAGVGTGCCYGSLRIISVCGFLSLELSDRLVQSSTPEGSMFLLDPGGLFPCRWFTFRDLWELCLLVCWRPASERDGAVETLR
jgi:hypothetical protein